MTAPRPRVVLLAAALLAPVVTGCSAQDGAATADPSSASAGSVSSSSAPSGATGSSAADAAGPTEVDVSATEFAFTLSQQEFAPGEYTFVLSDDGSAPHALTITGPGVDETSDDVRPGDSAELTVTLQPGDYELLCPVGDHTARGMRMTITVG
ncbi:hypothetical protein [Klenkia brasiliensis]|uniref:hypothetical protein n=1 Tax=Klenkia brasiliensis TaxID=333142 RepID=UPI001A95ED0E|nr:hypothetical protein [Klenkia brasiliensis]